MAKSHTARATSGAKSTRKRARPPSKQEARDRLAVYRTKRDFAVTPEPAPETRGRAKRKGALEFVVQKHDATRLHYDVRLEVAGAMMSWAVPKGPSFDPKVKRLAVETEDHPMAYNRFEGRIPDGGYGGGDVLIWDRGTYETVPPHQGEAMRAKGHFHVRFFGDKLVGEWHLVRTGGRGARARGGAKSSWLMFKADDDRADASLDIVTSRPESVVSGKSATRGPRRRSASREGESAAALLRTVGAPMRAVAAHELSDESAFLYEIKFDGYRLLGALADGDVELVTRKGNDWSKRFAPIAAAIGKLPVREAIVDGEACILDDEGRSSFQRLQAWLGGERDNGTLVFAVFDLLWVDGRDLRAQPIEERRQLLEALLEKAEAPLVFSKELTGPVDATLAKARRRGLEGVIAKRRGSTYLSGGSGGWWKLKFRKEQEVALAGYVPRVDAADEVGAVFIALATPDGKFEWGGKVGTGFDKATRKKLARMLDEDRSATPTVVDPPRLVGARWSKVKRVAQIELSEWTKDGSARAPSFIALREDKAPKDCVREREVPVAPATPTTPAKPMKQTKPTESLPTPPTTVPLTHPDKVLFPRDGITKGDVAAYYAAIADVMLPHLAGRPIGVQRWPNGIDGEAWFQQNAPEKVPPFVRLVDTGAAHGSKRKIVVDNAETLAWLSNLAAITIHEWASHIPEGAKTQTAIERALHQADYAVLDLDPGDGTWGDLIRVADTLRGLLEKLELESVVKTSGQRGLHVIVPFARGPSHGDVVDFAKKLATAVAKSLPEIATVERMKAKRGGRLYIDFLQNGEGKTIVAPYSIRPKDGAPVSTPIAWSEVGQKLDPSAFTIRTVPKRVAKVGDLLAASLGSKQAMPKVK